MFLYLRVMLSEYTTEIDDEERAARLCGREVVRVVPARWRVLCHSALTPRPHPRPPPSPHTPESLPSAKPDIHILPRALNEALLHPYARMRPARRVWKRRAQQSNATCRRSMAYAAFEVSQQCLGRTGRPQCMPQGAPRTLEHAVDYCVRLVLLRHVPSATPSAQQSPCHPSAPVRSAYASMSEARTHRQPELSVADLHATRGGRRERKRRRSFVRRRPMTYRSIIAIRSGRLGA